MIAVNNCSTDGSLDVLEKLEADDHRIKVLDIKKKGVSYARNTGLEEATGKWIQFLDADDYLVEDYLSQAVKLAEKSKADILIENFAYGMIEVQ